MIEGGGTVNAAALAEGVVHKVIAIVGPGLIGGADAPTAVDGPGPLDPNGLLRLAGVSVRQMGDDVVIAGYLPEAKSLLDAELSAEPLAQAATAREATEDR